MIIAVAARNREPRLGDTRLKCRTPPACRTATFANHVLFVAALDIYNLSADLSFALLALGFFEISSGEGVIGFLVMILSFGRLPQTHFGKSLGHIQPLASLLKEFFTILSSSE